MLSYGDPYLDELLGGLRRGSLVLIAGNPGTGKTILSAQCAHRNAVERGAKAMYVSMAEPREVFMGYMRGLGMDFEGLESMGLFRYLDLASPIDPSFMEGLLQEALKEAISTRVDLLVIDSLSAILQLLGRGKARSLVHTLFTRVVRAAGITTVAVVEVPRGTRRLGLGVEEFVADVVLLLTRREIEARLGRELEVVKARGVEVKHPRLLYTLHGGFKALPPMRRWRAEGGRLQPIEGPSGAYSTGVEDLDAVIGGYPRGAVVHLEVGDNVDAQQYHVFVAPLLASFVASGRGVIMMPGAGVDAGTVRRLGGLYGLADEDFNLRVRVVQPRPLKAKLGPPPWLVEVEGRSLDDDYDAWLRALRGLQESTRRVEVAAYVGADGVYQLYGEEPLYRLLSLEALRTRSEGGLLMVVTKPGLDGRAVRTVSNVSDVHLKLVRRRGALLIYGVKPRTELYAVSIDTSRGYPAPRLTPIV
ncbi:hypothetical protein B6U99_04615 [Candidatus Geothermarchaeota archaeon ex4572_27]|nr:MAG: hypothetical protein B6U99_04615 [Candidatus Geothermarchaeota archaeon ex4572_27]